MNNNYNYSDRKYTREDLRTYYNYYNYYNYSKKGFPKPPNHPLKT
jgi:hypothetical protein